MIVCCQRHQLKSNAASFRLTSFYGFDQNFCLFTVHNFCFSQFTRSLLVLQQCMRLNPKHPIVYLHAARICYEHLNMVSKFWSLPTVCCYVLQKERVPRFPVRAALRPRSRRTQSTSQQAYANNQHTAVHGSVHTAHKQHLWICVQICVNLLANPV